MTGFARAEGEADGISWVWELKSVNSRSLDLRLRLPPGFDALEPQLRAALASRCRRGNISATLSVTRLTPPAIRVNREMLAQIVALLSELAGADRGRAAAARRPDRAARHRRDGRGRAGGGRSRRAAPRFSTAGRRRSTAWSRARAEEGARLFAVLSAQRAELAALVEAAAGSRRGAAGGDPRAARRAARRAGRAGADHAGRAGRAGTGDAGHPRRCPRGTRPAAGAYRAGRRAAAARRRGRAPARFPVPGAEPRSQHAVLEIGRSSS